MIFNRSLVYGCTIFNDYKYKINPDLPLWAGFGFMYSLYMSTLIFLMFVIQIQTDVSRNKAYFVLNVYNNINVVLIQYSSVKIAGYVIALY
jgi:hypothetical protein